MRCAFYSAAESIHLVYVDHQDSCFTTNKKQFGPRSSAFASLAPLIRMVKYLIHNTPIIERRENFDRLLDPGRLDGALSARVACSGEIDSRSSFQSERKRWKPAESVITTRYSLADVRCGLSISLTASFVECKILYTIFFWAP